MSSRHTPPNPGSYLSTTPSSTTRSNTPIKLPLQMPSAPAPPRSWLGDPDDVPLDTLPTKHRPPPHRAQILTPQQASQITIPPPAPAPAPAPAPPAAHPSLGDEESRPASRDSDWNSTHPCFPHRNPYVPLDSALYHTTRVIRISRDFMVYGDQAPAYSNVFPDILEPHVTEEQFRAVVARVNADMRRAYDPWGVWNWVDALAGLATLWLWEELVDSHCKRVLAGVEAYLEGWNRDMERAGQRAVFVPLRRSGYMNLDIQIPNPLPDATDDDDDATESKYVDELEEEGEEGASETGSTIGPLGSEAGHHSLRMNSMNGRGSSGGGSGARMGSLGSGEYAPEGAGYR